jgi:hypothetical protein
MPIARFQLPDGRIARFEVPEGTTPEQAQALMAQHFSAPKQQSDSNFDPAAKAEPVDRTMGMSGPELFAAGAGKALSDLGYSVAQGASWLGNKLGLVSDKARADLQAAIDEKARIDKLLMDNDAAIGGNVAGALALGLMPGTGQLQMAQKANALWKAGGVANMARSLGTAAGLGAAQNAVMNPRTDESTLAGQLAVGGAAGAAGQLLAPALSAGVQFGRQLLSGENGLAGRAIGTAASAGKRPDADALRALADATRRNAVEIVPGSLPTGVQAADNAGISQLARTVANRVQGGDLAARAAEQNAARLAYLNSVAPIRGDAITAAEEAGQMVAQEARARRDMLKAARNEKYNEATGAGAAIVLPDKNHAQAVVERYYPGRVYDTAPAELRALVASLGENEPVTLAEFDALRKIAGNNAAKLADTDRTASAAFGAVKDLFNQAEEAAIAKGGPLMPPEAAAALRTGRQLHQDLVNRFDTGPARLLFQTGADNLPRAQGAEAARNFFNGGAAQAEAIDSLNRIVMDKGPGKQAMRSYAITDLVQSASNKADELSLPKYERWVEQHSQALKGLLNDEQLGKVKAVLMDLKRADRATNAGRAVGSNTKQNDVNDSLLGGVLLDALAAKVPYAGPWVAGSMRDAQRTRTAGLLDTILADPARTAGALQTYAGLLDPNLLQRGLIYTPAAMIPLAGGLLQSLSSHPQP